MSPFYSSHKTNCPPQNTVFWTRIYPFPIIGMEFFHGFLFRCHFLCSPSDTIIRIVIRSGCHQLPSLALSLDICLHNRRICMRWSAIKRFVRRPGEKPASHRLGTPFHFNWSPLLQIERIIVIYFLAKQPRKMQNTENKKWYNQNDAISF